MTQHYSLITEADKVNTYVIMKKEDYNSKVENCINENTIVKINNDSTNEYLKTIINLM